MQKHHRVAVVYYLSFLKYKHHLHLDFIGNYALFLQNIWHIGIKVVSLHPIDPATASRPQGM